MLRFWASTWECYIIDQGLPSITKGEIVGNIVFIDVKYMGRLQMSKINIARWRLLEILFLDF
jgi:hypothetical protein